MPEPAIGLLGALSPLGGRQVHAVGHLDELAQTAGDSDRWQQLRRPPLRCRFQVTRAELDHLGRHRRPDLGECLAHRIALVTWQVARGVEEAERVVDVLVVDAKDISPLPELRREGFHAPKRRLEPGRAPLARSRLPAPAGRAARGDRRRLGHGRMIALRRRTSAVRCHRVATGAILFPR
jgi:hypothetical protein